MSKKSSHYRGYIFLESLIAFTLTCFIIGNYFSLMTFLLKSKQENFDEITLRRILYEEIKQYEHHGGSLQRRRTINNQEYDITFSINAQKPLKMEITNGKRTFKIEKESI